MKTLLVWIITAWVIYQIQAFCLDYCKHHPDCDDCKHAEIGSHYEY